MQKTNFINKLFLEIKLNHYLLLLCAYSGMTEHIQVIFSAYLDL